ncbi:MAG TPA: 3,4-dehydroadipyl-CoA semialdehyde dehydrogenase [Thermodesulfobacteriota bacterium]|nr:3,4-dehydroadipyl-CoA semialdehyde dehydrogenase [Thermodesulfobacteriota bacterium]
MITLRSYLCGSWCQGTGEAATLVNPATEEPLAEASTRGLDLVGALAYARQVGGPELRALTFAQRADLLERMSRTIREARDALVEVAVANGGNTPADARFDIDGAAYTLAAYATLGRQLGHTRWLVEGEGVQLGRSPRLWGDHVSLPREGVAVHVNAFNFPAWGFAEKAAVALLAGVPVITKPATSTALLAFRIVERIVEARILPDGALQLVCGSLGDLLDHLGSQDHLAFTGSGSTGLALRSLRNLLARSVRVNIEADSLNAAILGPDVPPGGPTYGLFLRDAVHEMTQKAGQKCTATRRMFVPAALADRVQRELAERLAAVTVGNPALPEVKMGPLATAQQLREAREGVARLAREARIVFGSPTECRPVGVPAGKGYFMGPVLLRADDLAGTDAIHTHEVFGPVATMLPYRELEEALVLVRRGDGGLVASVYTDDRSVVEKTLRGLSPFHGRIVVGSAPIAEQATSPGNVLPQLVHGGPGRAGGGEELGGLRGLAFYMQRTAVQGDRELLDTLFGRAREGRAG